MAKPKAIRPLREYIVKDSSVPKHRNTKYSLDTDYSIRVGIVRQHVFLTKKGETRYIVEVWKQNKTYPMTCKRTSRFGGLYNYEEYNFRGYEVGEVPTTQGNFEFVPGDMVIVAAADGDSREGFILGSVSHFGRGEVLPADNNVAYVSEFNGLQTAINKDGEYRVQFKGAATNIDKLKVAPDGASRYPLPEYDVDVGFSYYEFDKTGSFCLTDNSNDELPQSIMIDKPNGKLIVTSGKTILTIDKAEESYTIVNKKTTFNSEDEWNLNTKKTTVKSSELVDIEAADIKTKGNWTQEGNVEVMGNIKQTGNTEIEGQFITSGPTFLAGGDNPLVYDIILTIGTGNLGAPVISNHVFLKTVKTKAT
jgi:hypothetical protein